MDNQTLTWVEALKAYAQGENIQVELAGKWEDVRSAHKVFESLTFSANRKYRLRPSSIVIGGMEVPEPLREAPKLKSTYYIPHLLSSVAGGHKSFIWMGTDGDEKLLRLGLVHTSPNNAALHAEALSALTAGEYDEP